MDKRERVAQLLVETGAFRDLDQPVILTSGELGIYYVNTEKLVQDNGEWERVNNAAQEGKNAEAVLKHALAMYEAKPTFKEVIRVLADQVAAASIGGSDPMISGGERRDWLFSGPVAHELGLMHVSLYKDGKTIQLHDPTEDWREVPSLAHLKGRKVVHAVDLITEGSSVYAPGSDGSPAKGWVPMLRNAGANIADLFAVVTRQQGGEQMLAKQNVTVDSLVSIDEEFARAFSKNPDRAVAYMKDPKAWSEAYLKENGALALLSAFDPVKQKDARAAKFWKRYGPLLMQNGKAFELDDAAQKAYGKTVKELVGAPQ
jgi:orotate phosphoribosyltransferase